MGTLVFLCLGPLLWAVQLTLIYGPQSSLCAYGIGTGQGGSNLLVAGLILIVSALCMGLAAAALLRPGAAYELATGTRPSGETWPFLTWVMRALAALSLLAMLYAGLGALLLPACAQLR
ncbi:hypothetical protein VE25_05740 [Devosia geojensis]|uniref:Uncharacterized protein n=2 Tax=Devosia geojensis TaxID=443610 RepID=A0A0F5FV24_9HYPH|nr:hypothetical protein VE25_05740 [Devosia geojensis]